MTEREVKDRRNYIHQDKAVSEGLAGRGTDLLALVDRSLEFLLTVALVSRFLLGVSFSDC